MKLIRWVEEHLSGRNKRSKDTRPAVTRRETNSLFYDPSLLPLHLELDPSCQLLRSQEGHNNTSRNHHHQQQMLLQQQQQQQQQLYDLGECEREESSLSACRPEPYATIALATHNGNWMLANYSQDQSSKQRQLRHSQYHSKLIAIRISHDRWLRHWKRHVKIHRHTTHSYREFIEKQRQGEERERERERETFSDDESPQGTKSA